MWYEVHTRDGEVYLFSISAADKAVAVKLGKVMSARLNAEQRRELVDPDDRVNTDDDDEADNEGSAGHAGDHELKEEDVDGGSDSENVHESDGEADG